MRWGFGHVEGKMGGSMRCIDAISGVAEREGALSGCGVFSRAVSMKAVSMKAVSMKAVFGKQPCEPTALRVAVAYSSWRKFGLDLPGQHSRVPSPPSAS
jgi:hypothetical protein